MGTVVQEQDYSNTRQDDRSNQDISHEHDGLVRGGPVHSLETNVSNHSNVRTRNLNLDHSSWGITPNRGENSSATPL